MYLIGRILLLGGLAATLIGGFDVSLLLRGTQEPEIVTLKALGALDGSRNVHLTITEFDFGEGVLINQDDKGKWRRIWAPLLTKDGQWTDRPIVLHSKHVKNDDQLDRFLEQSSVTGVVSNGLQGLGSNQREQFAHHYPGVDLSGAIAVEVDRRFPNPRLAYPVAILGVLALIAGMFIVFRR